MNHPNYDTYSRGADLVGVILTNCVISYTSYLGSRDSFTGEINLKLLVFKLLLHWASYLIVYRVLIRRNHFFKVPRWLLIALIGSLLAAVTFRIPVGYVYLEGVVAGLITFGAIALFLMGLVRTILWIFTREWRLFGERVSPMHDG